VPTHNPLTSHERRLLQSIVEVSRRVFGAAAASVFLIDRTSGDLVFEAVSGESEGRLIGARFPSGTGIAGWAVESGQSLLVDDVADNERFAREAAESTGYVPRSIMAAPLIADGECVGVIEVLDRGSWPRDELGDVDLLGLLATEVTLALEMLVQLRWSDDAGARPATPDGGDLALLRRMADRLTDAGPAATTVRTLLATADELLTADSVAVASPGG
jgi:GAF domain-containing protein